LNVPFLSSGNPATASWDGSSSRLLLRSFTQAGRSFCIRALRWAGVNDLLRLAAVILRSAIFPESKSYQQSKNPYLHSNAVHGVLPQRHPNNVAFQGSRHFFLPPKAQHCGLVIFLLGSAVAVLRKRDTLVRHSWNGCGQESGREKPRDCVGRRARQEGEGRAAATKIDHVQRPHLVNLRKILSPPVSLRVCD
jgi:hypothetical protein